MTDKTPKNKAENPVNTPTVLAGTTKTARDGELKSIALPQADALKERFKAGSIPLQTDFADLIDLANMGRQAVGDAENQTGPADGFTVSSAGLLELKPNTDKGISVDQDGISVKVNTSNGLKMTSSGIAINDGLGLEFGSTGQLNLKVKEDGGFSGGPGGACVIPGQGITIGSSGVGVKPGNGIAVNSSGVNVKLAKGSFDNGGGGEGNDGASSGNAGGLALSSAGLSVDAGNGIQIDPQGVSIKLAADSGLSADENNGLSIIDAQMLQKGMIIMFSGITIPSGWALCDGTNGTPNLIDRFIMAGKTADVGGRSSAQFTGEGDSKITTVSTKSSTVSITGNTEGTVLTIDQMPKHRHIGGLIGNTSDYGAYGSAYVGYSNGIGYPEHDYGTYGQYTSETGSGKLHSHSVNISSSHNHSISMTIPYYILAFIMKL